MSDIPKWCWHGEEYFRQQLVDRPPATRAVPCWLKNRAQPHRRCASWQFVSFSWGSSRIATTAHGNICGLEGDWCLAVGAVFFNWVLAHWVDPAWRKTVTEQVQHPILLSVKPFQGNSTELVCGICSMPFHKWNDVRKMVYLSPRSLILVLRNLSSSLTSPSFMDAQESIWATPTGNQLFSAGAPLSKYAVRLRTAAKVKATSLSCSSLSLLTRRLFHKSAITSLPFSAPGEYCGWSLSITFLHTIFSKCNFRELTLDMLWIECDGMSIEAQCGSSENKPDTHLCINVSRKVGADFLNPCSAAMRSHKTSTVSQFSYFFSDQKMLDPHHKKLVSDKAADWRLRITLLSNGIPRNWPPIQMNSTTAFCVLLFLFTKLLWWQWIF